VLVVTRCVSLVSGSASGGPGMILGEFVKLCIQNPAFWCIVDNNLTDA
jgi:hypothetical protein